MKIVCGIFVVHLLLSPSNIPAAIWCSSVVLRGNLSGDCESHAIYDDFDNFEYALYVLLGDEENQFAQSFFHGSRRAQHMQ